MTEVVIGEELAPASIASHAGSNGSQWTTYMARQYDLSIQKGHDALAIDPNNVWAHAYLGITLLQLGDTAEGVAQLQEANRLEEAPLLGAFLAYTGMLSAASVRKPSLC